MNTKNKTFRLALCAILSALGVALIYFGSLTDILDMSAAVIASVGCIFAALEFGGAYPWLIYAVTGVLSLILVPNPMSALMYILFFGFYPILKLKLERRSRLVCWILKEVAFNISLAALFLLWEFVFVAEAESGLVWNIVFIVLAEITFPVYDVALSKISLMYFAKIRKKLRVK